MAQKITKTFNHDTFVQKLAIIQPELTVISEYTGDYKYLLIVDSLGIIYSCSAMNLINGCKPTFQTAINKTLAFKIKLSTIQPNLNLISDFINVDSYVVVEDNLGIKYSCIAATLLRGSPPSILTAISPELAFQTKVYSIRKDIKLITSYVDSKTHIEFKCKDNFIHRMLPDGLLKNSQYGMLSVLDKNKYFIHKANKIHFNKYRYNNDYSHNKRNIKIFCYEHGIFEQTPDVHLRGGGCLKCHLENHSGMYESKFKYTPDMKTEIYFLKLSSIEEEFFKIGLSVDVNKRKYGLNYKHYKVEILETIKGTIAELFPLEQEFKKYFKQLKINYEPKHKFAGYTECFKW